MNAPLSRRWRLLASSQFLTSYELPCRVSDRVAIVYARSKPYQWGVYGYPNENGKPHETGSEPTLIEAKRSARKALDSMSNYSLYLSKKTLDVVSGVCDA